MRRCTRRRVQTLCLGLAFLSVLLHLLLVTLTLSMSQTPCEPHSQPPAKTIRALTDPNAEPPMSSHGRAPSGQRQPGVPLMDVGRKPNMAAQTQEESAGPKQNGAETPVVETVQMKPVSSPKHQPLKVETEKLFHTPVTVKFIKALISKLKMSVTCGTSRAVKTPSNHSEHCTANKWTTPGLTNS